MVGCNKPPLKLTAQQSQQLLRLVRSQGSTEKRRVVLYSASVLYPAPKQQQPPPNQRRQATPRGMFLSPSILCILFKFYLFQIKIVIGKSRGGRGGGTSQ